MNTEAFYALGLSLIIIGAIILIIAMLLLSLSKTQITNQKTTAAGIVLIGPIPIIFGTDRKSIKTILLLALAITIILLIITILLHLLPR
jgi:uncharacterized protein (TIGR00304 family)